MGYERYPRNSGGYDDRDQHQGYGRNSNTNGYGADRDAQGGGQASGSHDDSGQRGYGDDGDRQSRYRRDSGFQGQGARQGNYSQGSYGQGSSGQDNRGQSNYGQGNYGQGGAQDDRYGARDQVRPDLYGSGNRDRFQQDRGQDRGAQPYGPRGQGNQSNQPQGYDYDDRGFFDRAGDEVRSWFGDEDANRRRDLDARHDEQRYGSHSDEHYSHWRRSQIESLDRDYDEYRQENRSKFDSEFGSWRTQRQTQRGSLSQVTEHMEVVGSDGAHVGTVDKVRGDRIILTKNDADAGGRHHSIPSRWIQSVDEKVTISKTADDAKAHWRDEERNQAFFNEDGANKDQAKMDSAGNHDASQGPHILGRSFSGTY